MAFIKKDGGSSSLQEKSGGGREQKSPHQTTSFPPENFPRSFAVEAIQDQDAPYQEKLFDITSDFLSKDLPDVMDALEIQHVELFTSPNKEMTLTAFWGKDEKVIGRQKKTDETQFVLDQIGKTKKGEKTFSFEVTHHSEVQDSPHWKLWRLKLVKKKKHNYFIFDKERLAESLENILKENLSGIILLASKTNSCSYLSKISEILESMLPEHRPPLKFSIPSYEFQNKDIFFQEMAHHAQNTWVFLDIGTIDNFSGFLQVIDEYKLSPIVLSSIKGGLFLQEPRGLLCSCATSIKKEEDLTKIATSQQRANNPLNFKVANKNGCPDCFFTGFKGAWAEGVDVFTIQSKIFSSKAIIFKTEDLLNNLDVKERFSKEVKKAKEKGLISASV